ncbi:MAG: deoxyribose-phosphate aldolase [Lachnospiraceae bacterium]|nr:deoxyribose-phosphate aldolase [Lachnospiraceae bacterium]
MERKDLVKLFDHTYLKPYATEEDMEKLCREAKEYGFAMVAVNSVQAKRCAAFLKGSSVHVGAAISFPLGQTTIEAKVFETKNAIENGADEIDYVVNLTELKEGNYAYIQEEMHQIVSVCREHGVISKVIFENCFLNEEEKRALCRIALEERPDYIKTSTGFGTGGATLSDVKLMKEMVGDAVKVKAAGGIRDLDTCLAMVEAGAERIGTSASIAITEEFESRRK